MESQNRRKKAMGLPLWLAAAGLCICFLVCFWAGKRKKLVFLIFTIVAILLSGYIIVGTFFIKGID